MLRFSSSRRRHTILQGDWSSDVCSSDLVDGVRDMAFDLTRRRLEVTREPAGQNAILRALHDIGMRAVVEPAPQQVIYFIRSEERRVGKSVDLGGRRIIKKKKK